MRPWLRAVLKVVIMAATMSCGVAVPRHDDLPCGDQGQENGIFERTGRTWIAPPKWYARS